MKKYFKNILLILTFVLTLAFIGGNALFNSSQIVKADACSGTRWGPITWGECVSNGPQCGTDNGTQAGSATCVRGGCSNTCSLGTWVTTTYNCNLNVEIHDTNYNVSAFYNKPTGDSHHCHRINWGDLSDSIQDTFKAMHHNDHNYGPNHGNWLSAYNNHIDENPHANTETEGHFENPQVKTDYSQPCHTRVFQYDSCEGEIPCPETCGYEGGTVSDGKGGQKTCDPTDACPSAEECPTECGYAGGTVSDGQGGQKECGATEECSIATPTPEPTSTPSNGGGTPGGDGLSDGRSSCPGCTQAPAGGQVLGASTGPQVLGLSTTGGDGNVAFQLIQLLGALTSGVAGFALFKRNS